MARLKCVQHMFDHQRLGVAASQMRPHRDDRQLPISQMSRAQGKRLNDFTTVVGTDAVERFVQSCSIVLHSVAASIYQLTAQQTAPILA